MDGKVEMNLPITWAINQILYAYEEGVKKADIVAMAIRVHKGKVDPTYVSRKLLEEYPDMNPKEMLKAELTPSGRRALLHVKVPTELYEEAEKAAKSSSVSMAKTLNYMLHRLYDTGITVKEMPRSKYSFTGETVRVAINFPAELVNEAEKLYGPRSFRRIAIEALEDYIRRNSDGRGDSTT